MVCNSQPLSLAVFQTHRLTGWKSRNFYTPLYLRLPLGVTHWPRPNFLATISGKKTRVKVRLYVAMKEFCQSEVEEQRSAEVRLRQTSLKTRLLLCVPTHRPCSLVICRCLHFAAVKHGSSRRPESRMSEPYHCRSTTEEQDSVAMRSGTARPLLKSNLIPNWYV